MVQKNVEKFNEYRIVNSGTAMPAGDKQQPIAAKKVALRELPNETQNIFMKPPENSPLPKESVPASDVAKASNIKRQHPSSLSSPSRPLPPGSAASNGHLVYVRRKLETEASKIAAGDNVNSADSPSSRKTTVLQQEPPQETGVTPDPLNTSSGERSLVLYLGKTTETPLPEPNHSERTIVVADQPSPTRPSDQHWKERFLQLQTFLKNCDQSNQEEYIQKLRSLSAVGRSRHAVDLEKRAIGLLVEEAKELQQMRVLNVLGKASISTQIRSPEQNVRGK